jgi:signal transduction histidine kinase
MPRKSGDGLYQQYQSVFCIFMVALSFLYRDNSQLVYPNVFYLFIALLGSNLFGGIALKKWPENSVLATLTVLVNCAVITAILGYSGGDESNLWVLYLLPIYTSCLLLNGQAVFLILLGIVSFNFAYLWLSGSFDNNASVMFDVILKTAIFVFAGGGVWRVVTHERRHRIRLDSQRAEMIKLEEIIEDQGSNLKSAAKMADVGQLAAGIAHDLRNPLTVIIGSVKALIEEGQTQLFRPDLQRIERAAELCQTITSNVMELTRSDKFDGKPYDIREAVTTAVEILTPMLRSNGIVIKENKGAEAMPVLANPIHLKRIFLNLISNACSAMEKGGVLSVTIEKTTAPNDAASAGVRVLIEDTGPGFSIETLARLFKPFNTTKAPGEGTGLGLYLCREFAIKYNGRLNAENKPDQGARFILSFPLHFPESSASSVASAA